MSNESFERSMSEFANVPAVRLDTLMPRRVFVPMELVRGKNVKQLFEKLKSGGAFAVYWLHVRTDDKGNETTRWTKFQDLTDCRLPSSLWKDSYFEWEIPTDDSSSPVEVENPIDPFFPIELSLVVSGPESDECGLSIAWNPVLSDINRTCLMVTESPPDVGTARMLRGRRIIHLQVKKLAILPIINGTAPQRPPDQGELLTNIKSLVGLNDHRWQLRPRSTCFYAEAASRRNNDSAVLSIDFGTSCSTISILNIKKTGGDALVNVGLVRDLFPWTHATVFPNHNIEIGPGHIASETKIFSASELWRGMVPVVPKHVQVHRKELTRRKSAKVSSLLFAIPDDGDEAVTPHKEDAIGNEADQAFNKNLQDPKRKEWHRFRFSPKKQLGSTDKYVVPRADDHPIELYLRELFNQAMHTRLLESPSSVMVPIEKVAYSYPVTWTREQRRQYRNHLERAIKSSFISELIDTGRGHGIFDDSYAMDEASAAFLGFLLERFGGLQGNEVVDIFQPFNPSPDHRKNYPRSINALIFDCGEGTTDVVLLQITDSGELHRPVDSRVVRHFAMDKAGLEVTRRIAERLKEHLKVANPDKLPALRTNLHDSDSVMKEFQSAVQAGTAHKEQPMNRETYRRTLIYLIMKEAERLKIELTRGSARIDWTEIKRFTGLEVPTEREIEAVELNKIVAEVFAPAVGVIRRWLNQDIVLHAILMSGRSSQLPGLKELIGNSLPAAQRPFDIDFIQPGSFRLQSSEEGGDESSKTAVCKGLAMNFWNLAGFNHRALKCHPIDEKLRTRAIGILEMDVALRPLPSFDEGFELLVDSDNERVQPERDLPAIIERNPNSHGFYLGINFAGRSTSRLLADTDSPQPFCHVKIQNGREGAFQELRFVFRQISATEIRLAYVELETDDGNVTRRELATKDELCTSVDINELKIHLVPYRVDEDARATGRIHIDGADPLDHDW